MKRPSAIPWSGSINWASLRAHRHFLARRATDGGWWLAVGEEASGERPFPGAWSYGHVAYDHKNAFEGLRSRHPDGDGFRDVHWSRPRWVFRLQHGTAEVRYVQGNSGEAERLLAALCTGAAGQEHATLGGWQVRTARERYIAQVRRVLEHIQRGDVYELNYCVQRTTTAAHWDPFAGFARLMAANPAPHAAFYRREDHFALCASPERYLRIEQQHITAQPMKGTRRRHPDPAEDARLARALAADPKERSENIMAVDVMRNDLSRVAAPRSVVVEELCAVHAYPHVHQMISTIGARLAEGRSTWDAVRASFPMASMTGAPKRRAMELIDDLEDMRRGLFSGTLGLVNPDGDTDLNVVIRTLTYDASTGRASLITGSAITTASDPEQEWAECELKAHSVLNAWSDEG